VPGLPGVLGRGVGLVLAGTVRILISVFMFIGNVTVEGILDIKNAII
jgi:hypothetical protein